MVCTLFGGSSYECKKAVGGIQNCCEQPTSVNFVDYITMTFKVYMADSAMMSLNREMQPSFVGAYQDLHNSAVEIVKQGLSPVTKPLTSYAENISGAVKNFFQPLTAAIDEIKKKISPSYSRYDQHNASEDGHSKLGRAPPVLPKVLLNWQRSRPIKFQRL